MTKQAKVSVGVEHHEDGSFTHTMRFTNGQTMVHRVAPDHKLYDKFAANGVKSALLAVANSAKDSDEAVRKVSARIDAFDGGKWSVLGEGGPKFSPLTRALAELKGIEPQAADAIVKELSKGAQAKLRGTSRITALLAKYKAETENDGDDVLDGLLADGGEDVIERDAE